MLSTPFDWGWPLYLPVYGVRHALAPVSGSADVLWYRHWHEVFLRGALRSRLAGLGDCVIYAQDAPAARAALAARRDQGQQVVLAVHFRVSQADEWADKGRIPRNGRVFRNIRRLERTVIPQVDGLVYVSRWAREALTGWLPEAAAVPSAVIGNFVAPWSGTPSEERARDLVTIGSLEPVKNHHFLLRVLAAAKHAGRPLTLDVFGEGPLRDELRQQAHDLNLADQVRLCGFRRDLRDFLSGYRAYVHTSYSESSSLAIMEAMDAGLPIVAADIGPIAELVDEGVEGRFWALDDPVQAAAVLLELLDDEPNRLKIARAARERFKRDFDANVIGPRLWSFLLDGRS
jgi:glycosyltransferase involved in cell wall biosynthesis